MKCFSIKSVALAVVLSLSFHIASAEWVQSNGPWGGYIRALAASGDTVFAGTPIGLFMSVNRGVNWAHVKNGLPEDSWICALDISEDAVFAATGRCVSRSTDWGASWTNYASDNFRYYGMTTLSVGNSVIFVGTDDGGAVRSTDNGASWNPSGLNVEHVIASFIKDQALFASSYEGLFRSLDKGATWEKVRSGPWFSSFASNGRVIFAGSDSGIFRSSDTGSTWIKSTPAGLLDGSEVSSLASMGAMVFAGVSPGGILRSTDDGSTWMEAHVGLIGVVQSLAASGGNIFAGTFGRGVFLSTDNGDIWSSVNTGISNTNIYSCATRGSTVFAGTMSGLYRSIDNGISWSLIDNGFFNEKTILSLAMNTTAVFVRTMESDLFCTKDNGDQWTKVNNNPSDTIVDAIIASGSNIIAGTRSGVFLSTNNGSNWTKTDLGLTSYLVSGFAASGNTVFTSTDSGIFRSTDNGAAWIKTGPAMWSDKIAATTDHLFIVKNDSIFGSSDDGQTWTKAANYGFGSQNVSSFFAAGEALFVGRWDGRVFLSVDNGDNWTNTTSDPLGFHPGCLRVSSMASNGNTLFAGTDGCGIWRRPIGELINVKNIGTGRTKASRHAIFNIHPAKHVQTISFVVPWPEHIQVVIFDFSGKKIASLINARLASGLHRYSLNVGNYATGCYTVRIQIGSQVFVRSIVVVR